MTLPLCTFLPHRWENISVMAPKCVQECRYCGQVRVLHYRFRETAQDTYPDRETLERVRPKEVSYGH